MFRDNYIDHGFYGRSYNSFNILDRNSSTDFGVVMQRMMIKKR